MYDHDSRTRTRPDRRPLVAAAVVIVLVLAVGAWLLADGVGGDDEDGGGDEQRPVPAELTPSTLDADQRAEAEMLECLGGLSPDPTATVPPAGDCVDAPAPAPSATSAP